MAEQDKNLVIIDADSLVYIVGSEFKDIRIEPLGIEKLNEFILSILIATRSGSYLGFFGKIGARNFRYDVAKTKPYKGNRKKDKEDWLLFWEPILKEHMEVYWKFQPVDKIEADDAVIIAHQANIDKYNKVTIASPDKDLRQQDGFHYDYKLRLHLDITPGMASRLFLTQMLKGDTGDNIPGLPSMGKIGADKVLEDLNTFLGTDEDFIKKAYKHHFEVTLTDKAIKKQEKEFLVKFRKNSGKRSLKALEKSEALKDFKLDTTDILDTKEILELYDEMHTLLRMLNTEAEGKEHDFTLKAPLVREVDWDSILDYITELQDLDDTQSFDFLNEI